MEKEKTYTNITRETHKRVEVLLTPELYDALKAKAVEEDYTVANIVKRAIKKYLAEAKD